MEKFQIVRYALMQIAAIIYGVLASGTAVKINRTNADLGFDMPAGYFRAIFFRDYGCWLFVLVLLWASFVSYHSSPLSNLALEEKHFTATGIFLAALFAIAGTILAVGGAIPPAHASVQP